MSTHTHTPTYFFGMRTITTPKKAQFSPLMSYLSLGLSKPRAEFFLGLPLAPSM
jgi:hypothetical protein